MSSPVQKAQTFPDNEDQKNTENCKKVYFFVKSGKCPENRTKS